MEEFRCTCTTAKFCDGDGSPRAVSDVDKLTNPPQNDVEIVIQLQTSPLKRCRRGSARRTHGRSARPPRSLILSYSWRCHFSRTGHSRSSTFGPEVIGLGTHGVLEAGAKAGVYPLADSSQTSVFMAFCWAERAFVYSRKVRGSKLLIISRLLSICARRPWLLDRHRHSFRREQRSCGPLFCSTVCFARNGDRRGSRPSWIAQRRSLKEL
jgi:hypothetical protein